MVCLTYSESSCWDPLAMASYLKGMNVTKKGKEGPEEKTLLSNPNFLPSKANHLVSDHIPAWLPMDLASWVLLSSFLKVSMPYKTWIDLIYLSVSNMPFIIVVSVMSPALLCSESCVFIHTRYSPSGVLRDGTLETFIF